MPAKRQYLVEALHLADPERGCDITQPVVQTEADVLEPAARLRTALVAERAHEMPLVLRVRHDHPALARRQLLVGIEREDARDAV